MQVNVGIQLRKLILYAYFIRCECTSAMQCLTNHCERGRCVGTQVEGVVGIDIRYGDFHNEVMSRTRSMCQGDTR